MNNIKFLKSNDDEFELVKHIRRVVFQQEQGVNPDEDIDLFDADAETDYVLVYRDDKPVGTGRIIRIDGALKLGRIAVLKEYRGCGLGAVIVKSLVAKAFDNGEKVVNINSQNHAIGFYRQLGFEVCGEELVEIGIPHTPMRITSDSYKGE